MPIPLAALIALQAVGQGTQQLSSSLANRRQQRQQQQMSRGQMQFERDMANQDVAVGESMADPFRHQMAQAGNIARLDAMERASYAPVTLEMPEQYQKYVPKMSGGFSWEPSEELRASAGALKQNVMAGRTAPSMTDPQNYGKTGALDLHAVLAGTADPRTDAAMASGAPVRENLGAPPAPSLTAPWDGPTSTALTKLAKRNRDAKRTKEVAAWEQEHPGWTVDLTTGQVVRKGGA